MLLASRPKKAAQVARALALPMLLALATACLATPGAPVAADAQTSAEAHRGRFLFRSYGAELGLSNVNIFRLLQDRAGFIWTGTEDGLYRYDGYRFAGFGMKDGLLSSSITALFEDASGLLWVGTQAGLSRRDGQRFSPVPVAGGVPALAIAGIAESEAGIWAATARGPYVGKARFAPAPGWPGGEATAILASKRSATVWVAQWDDAARMLAYRDGRWTELEAPAGQPKERIDAIAEDGAGHVWARTATSLWTAAPGAARFALVATPIALTSSVGYLSTGPRGTLYVSSDVGVLRRVGQRWETMTAENGLPGSPWPVLEDREGSLWIGSVGLHRLLGRGVMRTFGTAEGLPNEVVWSVYRDRAARLWVGTNYGLAVLDGNRFRTVKGTGKHTIRSISQGSDGTLYLGGVPGNEILSYHPDSGKLRRHSLGGDPGLEAHLPGAGRKGWRPVGQHGRGRAVACRHGRGRTGVRANAGARRRRLRIHERHRRGWRRPAGRVWVAGQNGLAMLEKGQWRRFTHADGLLRDHVAYVRPLEDGSLLLPYFDPLGVSRVNYAKGKLALLGHYDSALTRSADKVFFVGVDARQRIWIGGGLGADMLAPERTWHFGAAEGLAGEDTTSMSFLGEPNGDVWFGTSKGLQHFRQEAFEALPPPPAPRTTLTHITVGGVAFDAAARDVRVLHDTTLEVQYAGIAFVGEGKIQYRQRLLGRERDFNIVDNRSAHYSALQYGHYSFEVAARIGPHGAWGPTAVFGFEVLPAWWESWWLRALAAVGATLSLLLAYRWRVARLQRENLRLEALVAARTGDLQMANAALREASMIDPLTGLKNRRYLDAFMPEELARTLRQQRCGQSDEGGADEHNIDLCLIMVDLDHFKMVNDEHGHAAGDKVLVQAAQIMRATCRASDVVVRWGGEEFLVIARNIDRKRANVLAGQLCAAIRAHHFDIGNGMALRKTCSLGFTAFPLLAHAPDRFNWEQGVELADQCLYAAKRTGRDGWVGCLLQDEPEGNVDLHAIPGFGKAVVLSSWPGGWPLQWQ